MGEALLKVEGLVAGYAPGAPILNGVDIRVQAGEIACLIGPNGAGKSTLVKAVAGLTHIERGRIALDGVDITGLRPDRLAERAVAFTPQNANVFTTLTVRQNLILAAQRISGDRRAAIERAMTQFPMLAEKAAAPARGLSGGQRQTLAIAMALIAAPRLLLMDEPTAGLSPKAAQEALALIVRVAADGVAVLLVEQNARAALRIAHRGHVLAEGRVRHSGDGAALLGDPEVGRTYLGGGRRAQAAEATA